MVKLEHPVGGSTADGDEIGITVPAKRSVRGHGRYAARGPRSSVDRAAVFSTGAD